jgi:hypothetical protein
MRQGIARHKSICVILSLVILLSGIVSVGPVQASNHLKELKAIKNDSGIKLLLNENNSRNNFKLSFVTDASSLLTKGSFPQHLRVKAYTLSSNEEQLISIINRTIYNNRQAENFRFELDLPRDFVTADVFFDLYDADGVLRASFQEYLVTENQVTEVIEASIQDSDCDPGKFGDCQIKHLLDSLNFIAVASSNRETVVKQEASGKFTVELPLMRVNNMRVNNHFNPVAGASASLGTNQDQSDQGILGFISEGVRKAIMSWDETTKSVELFFGASKEAMFSFSEDGKFSAKQLEGEKFKLKPLSSLNEPLENGTIEFDGAKLYITKNGRREVLGEVGPQGPPGPRGTSGTGGGGMSSTNPTITGAMKITPQEDPPASPEEGQIYHDTSPAICVYMNGIWGKLYGTGTCAVGTDSSPDAFSFTDLSAAPDLLVESNLITPANYDYGEISIAGDGNPEYSIDGGVYTSVTANKFFPVYSRC